jgi:hypothetical protein
MWSVTRIACVGSIWQLSSNCAMRSCGAEVISHEFLSCLRKGFSIPKMENQDEKKSPFICRCFLLGPLSCCVVLAVACGANRSECSGLPVTILGRQQDGGNGSGRCGRL